jgi:two-component system sensor histidine kinase HydH
MLEPEEKDSRLFFNMPSWLKALLFLVAALLAVMVARRDLGRERDYLQELYRQKGEILVRSLEMSARLGQLALDSTTDLAEIRNLLESPELLYIAITTEQGELVAASVPGAGLGRETFDDPVPIASFRPQNTPAFRVSDAHGGKKVFWVYRPLWSTVSKKIVNFRNLGKTSRHHEKRGYDLAQTPLGRDREPGHRPHGGDPWEGRNLYGWLGFDMAPFEEAESSARGGTLAFIGLLGITSLAGLLALFWAQSSRMSMRLYENSTKLATSIFSRLPVGLLVCDQSDRVKFVNLAMEKISGLSRGDFLDRKLPAIAYGDFPREEEFSGIETEVSFPGGKLALVSMTGGPVIGQKGRTIGRVILMADLDELGRLKAELSVKERLATLGGMARGLAHELRNPLGAISGLTLHLQQVDYLKAAEREALGVILTSVERLAGTITDFLEYAKPLQLNETSVSLGGLLSRLQSLVVHDPAARAVHNELTLPDFELMARVDEPKLSQALLNLYLNAIQAASAHPPGPGRVGVTLGRHAPGLARIVFEDDGPGFSPAQLSRPFVPYVTSKAQGTGLGLALAKKIIEAHDGQLVIANKEGGGAMVTVVVPLDASAGADAPKGNSPSGADNSSGANTGPESNNADAGDGDAGDGDAAPQGGQAPDGEGPV